MFGVFLAAANSALLPSVFVPYAPVGLVFGVLGILPMVNIVAIVCYRARPRRPAGRALSVGFALTGALLAVVWFNVCMTADEKQLMAFNAWMYRTVTENPFVHGIALSVDSVTGSSSYLYITLLIHLILFILTTTVPQLLLALIVGWVAHRITAAVHTRPVSLRQLARPDSPYVA
jgi:hypothetical protein